MSLISVAAGQTIRATHVQQFTNFLTAQKLDTPGTIACTSTTEYALTVRSQEGTTGLALAVQYGSSAAATTLATFNKARSRIQSSDGAQYLDVSTTAVNVVGTLTLNGDPIGSTYGIYNIRDYGAETGIGNASATTLAIGSAYNALVTASGGVLFIPAGDYFHTDLSFTYSTPFAIAGEGPYVSSLCPTATAGTALYVSGPSVFSISDLGLRPDANRNAGSYLLHVSGCSNVWADRLFAGDRSGGLFKFESCNSVIMSAVKGLSSDGTTGDTCLRIVSSSGSFTGLNLQTGAGGVNRAPTVHLSGTVTSARFSDNVFGGLGYRASYGVSSITSDAAKFTVVTTSAHDFVIGDIVAIRGTTGTGSGTYNDEWRVGTVPTATSVTVTTTANPGTPTVGSATLESIASGFLAENSTGPLNENMVASTLISNQSAATFATVGFHFDGKRGTSSLQGWELTGNWYDAGRTGLLISGKDSGATSCTAYGFTVTGGKFAQITRPIHLDRCAGITIAGVQAGNTGSTANDDDGVGTTAALYVYNGGTAPYTQGITVTNSHLGWPRDMKTVASSTPFGYGVLLDGGSMVDLMFEGNQVIGNTAAFGTINGALTNGLVWKIANNSCGYGTVPIAVNTVLPTVTSANTIAATVGYDSIIISGTTNIATITGGWLGRQVTLLFSGALSLVTGGNLAIAANRSVLAGDAVTLVFDGANWYAR